MFLTEQEDQPEQPGREPEPLPFPLVSSLPAPGMLAFETESSDQWNSSLGEDTLIYGASDCERDRGVIIADFVTKFLRCSVTGSILQNKQLVLTLPVPRFDMNGMPPCVMLEESDSGTQPPQFSAKYSITVWNPR